MANNKTNMKNVAKTVNQTVQQTNAMKKVIESRGENNNCNDEFSQWCCKHLATLNKNTIDSEYLFIIVRKLINFNKYIFVSM